MSALHGEPKGRIHDASASGLTSVEADFVIVGSGAGGGAAARSLAASGRSVVVLEEGPYLTSADVKATAAEGMAQVLRHSGQSAAFGKAAVPMLQGRVVGGTTFVNSAIIWRIPEKVIHRWHGDKGIAEAWNDAAMDGAYRTIEEELFVRPVTPENRSGSDVKMAVGAEKAGIEHRPIHRSEKGCLGSARCLFGCPNRAKQSTALNYLMRAVDDGAHVFAHAEAKKLEREGGRIVAVSGRIGGSGPHAGERFQVRARKAVIVAASVVQSPNLLRRSGIGTDNSALGNHFMAHPGTALTGIYPDRIDMWSGAAQGYEAYGLRDTLGAKFESINVPPEVAASRFPGAGRRFGRYLEKLRHAAAWSVALKAEAEGTVRPSRIFGGDMVRYEVTHGDLQKLRAAMKRLAEMHFLAGATEVLPNVYGLPEVLTGLDDLKHFDNAPLDPRSYSLVATHLFGTCRAGSDPRHAVVDADLKVHGVDGLYVMDASVMPSNTGVNPQHGIMAVATVASRRLAAG
jgi:choline dehydrogenase-like flavoprotein